MSSAAASNEISTPCFMAQCASCGKQFAMPALSEFSYGEFIFTTEDGAAFAYLNTNDDPVVDDIQKIIESIKQTKVNSSTLLLIVSKVADSIGGSKISPEWICPVCGSSQVSLDDSHAIGKFKISKIQFENFKAMSRLDQVQLIANCLGG